jgi:hypothetical protein
MKEYQAGILADYVPYTPLTAQNLKKLADLSPKRSPSCTALALQVTAPEHSMTSMWRYARSSARRSRGGNLR